MTEQTGKERKPYIAHWRKAKNENYYIAIDENGKVLFTTQTLGLNPEVLDKEEIINRLDDKFDISQNKDKATHLFFYGAGCGTDRMKDFLTLVFKD